MASKDTFCNSAWYELHVFWDGAYGYCCNQKDTPYPAEQAEFYNVKNMSIAEWFDSEPMRKQRLTFNTITKNPLCIKCWDPEESSGTSRRHRQNQKSVIFQKENFDDSYLQSPNYSKFEKSFAENGEYKGLPIDLHIDLGNHCNLACKMCWAGASSKIAAQEYKWGELSDKRLINNNWTNDDTVWNRVLDEIINIPNLQNIHFMGGETLLSSRFQELVDRFDSEKRYSTCFSFVTNGTIFNETLIAKLSKFKRVGIEVSIETLTPHNEYIRQGTQNYQVLSNIDQFLKKSNFDNITVTIRPAVSLLSVGYYNTLLEYCLDKKLTIKSLPVVRPEHLKVNVLPKYIREQYKKRYIDLIEKYNLDSYNTSVDYNESDWHNYKNVIRLEIQKVLYDLDASDHPNQKELLETFITKSKKWDNIYNFNMRDYYPEFREILDEYSY